MATLGEREKMARSDALELEILRLNADLLRTEAERDRARAELAELRDRLDIVDLRDVDADA